MDRPQLIRRLRIAASVFFAVVTVALCVLWVRSYWRVRSCSARHVAASVANGFIRQWRDLRRMTVAVQRFAMELIRAVCPTYGTSVRSYRSTNPTWHLEST